MKKNISITIIGRPNAGKSTLINKLIDSDLFITHRKAQTTRVVMDAICVYNDVQMVFFDTPGIFNPNSNRNLENKIVDNAWKKIKYSHNVAIIIDAKAGIKEDHINAQKKLTDKHIVVIINKIDLVPKESLLKLSSEIQELFNPDKIFMISALKNYGIEDIKEYLASQAIHEGWYYDEDQISTSPVKILAEEITRCAIMDKVHEEIPYSAYVDTESWQEKDKSVVIKQIICVLKESQKKIILGHQGQTIKSIGFQAKKEIRELINKKVHLYLFVKVRKDWIKKIDTSPYFNKI